MPVVLRSGAVRFYFYSNEGKPLEPPNVHVRKGYDEAKFWLTPVVAECYNDGLDGRTYRLALDTVRRERAVFEEA